MPSGAEPPRPVELRAPKAHDGLDVGALFPAVDGAPSPPANHDELDWLLIESLLKDGKTTNRELAAHGGVSESSVSVRLRRLIDCGAVIFTALIDWEAVGFDWFVVARIKTRSRPPRDVAADIAELEQSDAVVVTFGTFDVVGYFLVTDRTELRRLVDVDLASIKGIASLRIDLATESFATTYGHRLFVAKSAAVIRLPAPRIQLDDLDAAILQALVLDGRQSSRNIARALEVSEGTVRSRVGRMTEAGLVRVVAQVDPVALGLVGVVAFMSLQVDRSRVDDIRTQLCAMAEVIFVAVCVGYSDLSVTLSAANLHQLNDLVATQVQTIDGVRETEILVMSDIVMFNPYLKRF